MTGNDKEDILELLAANERMGAALDFLYREYPEARCLVAEYLMDYPFMFLRP